MIGRCAPKPRHGSEKARRRHSIARVIQWLECHVANVNVAGSSPAACSKLSRIAVWRSMVYLVWLITRSSLVQIQSPLTFSELRSGASIDAWVAPFVPGWEWPGLRYHFALVAQSGRSGCLLSSGSSVQIRPGAPINQFHLKIKVEIIDFAVVAKWHTRTLEGRESERVWRFNSSRPHHLARLAKLADAPRSDRDAVKGVQVQLLHRAPILRGRHSKRIGASVLTSAMSVQFTPPLPICSRSSDGQSDDSLNRRSRVQITP